MDTDDITCCSKCGGYYNLHICSINKPKYMYGSLDSSGKSKCPICGHVDLYE